VNAGGPVIESNNKHAQHIREVRDAD
jgi:hypothetical protein